MSGLAAWMARTIGVKSVGRRRIGLVVDDLEAVLLGVARARPRRRCGRTPRLRPTSATVSGFGFCAAATWKKPSVKDGLVFGPVGIIAKNFVYLNSVFTSSPNRMMKVLPFCMTTGMAGAIMLVA